jgi:hypothetical protein
MVIRILVMTALHLYYQLIPVSRWVRYAFVFVLKLLAGSVEPELASFTGPQ